MGFWHETKAEFRECIADIIACFVIAAVFFIAGVGVGSNGGCHCEPPCTCQPCECEK